MRTHEHVPEEPRAAWLELARRQSRRLAEERVKQCPSLRWERLNGEQQVAWQVLRPRMAWAFVLLPVLVLGASTATLALVHHLRAHARRPKPLLVVKQAPAERVHRREWQANSSARQGAVTPAAEALRPGAQGQPGRPPKKRPPRRTASPRPSQAAEQPPCVQSFPTVSSKPEHIEFGTVDAPDDGIIIVAPRAKMPPLWTPEEYKKSGRRSSMW